MAIEQGQRYKIKGGPIVSVMAVDRAAAVVVFSNGESQKPVRMRDAETMIATGGLTLVPGDRMLLAAAGLSPGYIRGKLETEPNEQEVQLQSRRP